MVTEGVSRFNTRRPLAETTRSRGRPIAKVPLVLVVPKFGWLGEGGAVLRLLTFFNGQVFTGEHVDCGDFANRDLNGIGTLSDAALASPTQFYGHDVWRVTVVLIDVVHRSRRAMPLRPQRTPTARHGRAVAEVPCKGEFVDTGRRGEGCPETGYLPDTD